MRYSPPGAAAITASVGYTIPAAPWVHVSKTPGSLGVVENPRRIVVPITFTSEDNVPRHVTVGVSGWSGMTISPSSLAIRPFGTATHVAIVLAAQSVPTTGLHGTLDLHFQSAPGTILDRHLVAVPYRLLPSLLRVSGVPKDFGSISDLVSGHLTTVTVGTTVFHPASLAVRVEGGSASPAVLRIPSAKNRFRSSQELSIRVPNAAAGRHGTLRINFVPLNRGVRVQGGTATVAYYVPTWWDSNWKWVVPALAVIILAIYLAIAYGWERVTRNWDTRQRAIVGR